MSNFTFLESHWEDLAKLGDLSEKYVYSDPNTSIIKQGMLAEVMVKYMLAYDGISEPEYDNTHANRIRILKNNDLLPGEIDNTWYIQTYGDYNYVPAEYVQPVDNTVSLEELEKENAELEARNQQLLIEIQKSDSIHQQFLLLILLEKSI